MEKTSNAGCLCGRIRLLVQGDPVTVLQCHCSDCQKSTGGGPVLAALYPREQVNVTQGTPSGFTVTGDSGMGVRRCFCPTCGAQLFSELGKYPDHIVLKSGIWDADPGFTPASAIWTGSAPGWHLVPADIPAFPGARP